jgi:BirA family biotin operon repressor/biotin-[acetyl-CoA-carboxylase] ligase
MKFEVIHIDETDSTNRWLRSFVSKEYRREEERDLVVLAEFQTAGKGCGTNQWESECGKNLTFSMLIHPAEIPANEQFRITQVASVAMCETLKQYGCKEVSIKWPNDIYVGDKKICGMLIENRLQGSMMKDCIIGIGLNVNQREFLSDAPNPVSLYQLLGHETDREALLKAYLDAFDSAYNSKTTCSTYKEMLYRRRKNSLYKDKTSCFHATLTDVQSDGRLLLVDQEGRERLYAFKEVQFII